MNEVEELRQERNSVNTVYIQFLAEFKATDRLCYGFVEGKDDPSFYRSIINNSLENDFRIQLYPAGSKGKVKQIYNLFDWTRFSLNQIVFFIDRDLFGEIADPNIIEDKDNVYITDHYAIENSIVNSETCVNVLKDIQGFSSVEKNKIDDISMIFDQQYEFFLDFLLEYVMGHILYWKIALSHVKKSYYANVRVDDFFIIKNGVFQVSKDSDAILDSVYTLSRMDIENDYNKDKIDQIIDRIRRESKVATVARGKYLIPFMIKFCNSIKDDCAEMNLKSKSSAPTLSNGDFMKIIAPRCILPVSLKRFIKRTVKDYSINYKN